MTAPGLVAPTLAGHVQMLYFEDLRTGEILYITPSHGGIWLNDFDLGYPDIREVSNPIPDAHGTSDETQYYGARAVTASFTCIQSNDDTGDYVTAVTWADTLRAWSVLDRKIKAVYQLLDQNVRQMFLRTSQLGAPIPGSGIDRTVQRLTMGWKCPDGILWAKPLPTYAVDPTNPDNYMLTIFGASGGAGGIDLNDGTGIDLAGGTGIDLGGGGGTTANRIAVPVDTLGSVPIAPVMRIRGGSTQPKFSIGDAGGVVRSKFEFTQAVGGVHLVVAPADVLVIDVANRTAMINPDDTGIGINVSKYLTPPVNWKTFRISPQHENVINYYPQSANAGSVVEISYGQGFV